METENFALLHSQIDEHMLRVNIYIKSVEFS